MEMMDGRSVQWGRRRYALLGRTRWMRFPRAITLPGGQRHERYAYLFWRVRLPLWLVPTAAGWAGPVSRQVCLPGFWQN
jgi:hypothetical protein